ncbi:MAG: alpha-ribazole phosphatase [Desulfobacula sp.]|nr:alpha-ribazole phosphatase [Desulfobacula sp.]
MNILNSYAPGSKRFLEDLLNIYCRTCKNNSLIFLLRHGQIQDHETKRFIGQTDIPLDSTGIKQAMSWQKSFASIKFNTVYSSTLKRCSKTAQIVSPQNYINIDSRLNEIDLGEWDGKTFDEIKKNHSEEFKKRGRQIYHFQPARGESFKDLSKRILPFFNKLNTKPLEFNIRGNKTLVVTHAGVIRMLVCHILGINPQDMFKTKLDYGQLFVLKIEHTI